MFIVEGIRYSNFIAELTLSAVTLYPVFSVLSNPMGNYAIHLFSSFNNHLFCYTMNLPLMNWKCAGLRSRIVAEWTSLVPNFVMHWFYMGGQWLRECCCIATFVAFVVLLIFMDGCHVMGQIMFVCCTERAFGAFFSTGFVVDPITMIPQIVFSICHKITTFTLELLFWLLFVANIHVFFQSRWMNCDAADLALYF